MTRDELAPLREFVVALTRLVEVEQDEAALLDQGEALLARLIARDDWLPASCAQPQPDRYAQYLLHADPLQRFSVVSFVWGPGQTTPVHDHTVWGLVGTLRGAELGEAYELRRGVPCATGVRHVMRPGDIDRVSPRVGDWHRVSNALDDQPSISIHVYGGNIGTICRHVYDAEKGIRSFISGYSNDHVPNLWTAPVTAC